MSLDQHRTWWEEGRGPALTGPKRQRVSSSPTSHPPLPPPCCPEPRVVLDDEGPVCLSCGLVNTRVLNTRDNGDLRNAVYFRERSQYDLGGGGEALPYQLTRHHLEQRPGTSTTPAQAPLLLLHETRNWQTLLKTLEGILSDLCSIRGVDQARNALRSISSQLMTACIQAREKAKADAGVGKSQQKFNLPRRKGVMVWTCLLLVQEVNLNLSGLVTFERLCQVQVCKEEDLDEVNRFMTTVYKSGLVSAMRREVESGGERPGTDQRKEREEGLSTYLHQAKRALNGFFIPQRVLERIEDLFKECIHEVVFGGKKPPSVLAICIFHVIYGDCEGKCEEGLLILDEKQHRSSIYRFRTLEDVRKTMDRLHLVEMLCRTYDLKESTLEAENNVLLERHHQGGGRGQPGSGD